MKKTQLIPMAVMYRISPDRAPMIRKLATRADTAANDLVIWQSFIDRMVREAFERLEIDSEMLEQLENILEWRDRTEGLLIKASRRKVIEQVIARARRA